MKKLWPALAGALLVYILCGCSFLERGPQSSPQSVMEAYLGAFQGGDFETMLRLSTAPGEEEAEPAHLQNFMAMFELVSYSILQVESLSETEAAVEVELTMRLMGHERRLMDSVRVVRREGKWYIQGEILEGS